jgi:hypothetical protein
LMNPCLNWNLDFPPFSLFDDQKCFFLFVVVVVAVVAVHFLQIIATVNNLAIGLNLKVKVTELSFCFQLWLKNFKEGSPHSMFMFSHQK